MAQRRSLAWTELKVGLLVIAGFLVLAYAIVRIGGPSSFSEQTRSMSRHTFHPPTDCGTGADVWLDGLLVGNVTDVGLNRTPMKGQSRRRDGDRRSLPEPSAEGFRSRHREQRPAR